MIIIKQKYFFRVSRVAGNYFFCKRKLASAKSRKAAARFDIFLQSKDIEWSWSECS